MYGLPPDINLDFFLNKTLLQICIGAHDLIFNFDDYLSISITSSISYEDSNGKVRSKSEDFRNIISNLTILLNQPITSVIGNEDGTLRLEFNGGQIIEVYDDSEMYESYIIKNGDHEIIV